MVLHGTRNTAMSKDLLGLCGWSNGDFAVFHTMIATCLCVFVVSVYSRCTCYARLSSPPVDESRVSSYNQGKNADRRWVPVHRLHEFYKMSLQKDSRSDYLSSNEQLDSLGEFKWATWFQRALSPTTLGDRRMFTCNARSTNYTTADERRHHTYQRRLSESSHCVPINSRRYLSQTVLVSGPATPDRRPIGLLSQLRRVYLRKCFMIVPADVQNTPRFSQICDCQIVWEVSRASGQQKSRSKNRSRQQALDKVAQRSTRKEFLPC